MIEVAERIQIGGRAAFTTETYASTFECEYSTNHFLLRSPEEGGTITVTSAGAEGTDIGTAAMACHAGAGGGTVTTPAFTDMGYLATLTAPQEPTGTVEEKHWTHYAVYRSLDVGVFGIDPASGVANPTELYTWVNDVHMARAWTLSIAANIVTIAGGRLFHATDQDCVILLADATTRTLGYLCTVAGVQIYPNFTTGANMTSAYAYTAGGASAAQAASIGTSAVITAQRTVSGAETIGASTVTRTAGSTFAAADVNRTIFWEDGSESHIVRYVNANVVEVAEDDAVASMAGALRVTSRLASDYTPDSVLRNRQGAKELLLQNRLWEPIGNGSLGVISSGFLFGAARGEQTLYYSQMPEGLEYMAGCHNPEFQSMIIRDAINVLLEFADYVTVGCQNSTHNIAVNTFENQTIEQVAVVVAVLSGAMLRNDSIGMKAAIKADAGNALVVTTEPGVRIYDGLSYGKNLIEGRIVTIIRQYNSVYALSYDAVNGLMMWCQYAASAGLTDKCWQYGFNEEQGYGPSEITGAAWPFTEVDAGTVLVYDTDDTPRQLALNNATGQWNEVSTRTGPNTTQIWKDGAAVAGTGGTAVVPYFTRGEDRGTFEHYYLRHLESMLYVRPIDESVGLPTGITFDLDFFSDGEPTTPTDGSDEISTDGRVRFKIPVRAHRLQAKVTADMGQHRIAGFQTYYVTEDAPSAPANQVTTEDDYQRELNLPAFWLWLKNGAMINRITGAAIAGTVTAVAGPDDHTEGITITAAVTGPSVTCVAGSLFIWYTGVIAVTIGGTAVALTDLDTSGAWTLAYANAITLTGAVVVTPTGAANIFDFRVFSTALSTAALTYYFNDVDANDGDNVLPR